MKKYFLQSNGRSIGPYSAEDLRMMNITSSTPVWFDGLGGWKNAGEVPELNYLFAAPTQNFTQPQYFQTPFQTPANVTPNYHQNENLTGARTSNNSTGKIILIIVSVIVLLGGAVGYFAYWEVQKFRQNFDQTMHALDTLRDMEPPTYDYDTSGIIISAPTDSDPNATQLYKEKMPEFPGGDIARNAFIRNTIRYPDYARENDIQGTVYVRFMIDKEGYVTDPEIFRSVDPSLDKEALRMVKKMPRWKPATINGVPVKMQMTQPVRFVLN